MTWAVTGVDTLIVSARRTQIINPQTNLETAIFCPGRLTLFFLVILLCGHASAQDGDELLREFSAAERALLRNACYGASLSGPARFHACLSQKVDELRRVPSPPTLENQRVSEGVVSVPAAKRPKAPRASGASNPRPNRITSIVPIQSEPATPVAAPQTSRPSPPSRATATRPRDDLGPVAAFWLTVGGLVWGVQHVRRSRQSRFQSIPDAAPAPPTPGEPDRPEHADTLRRGITFADLRTDIMWSPPGALLTDVGDGVTGRPVRPTRGLHRCAQCHVSYETSSVEFIRRENDGCCVGCGSTSVVPLAGSPADEPPTREDQEEITTLANYRSRVGEVVVFEGRCVRVLPSRRGTAYAVMFEEGGWTDGFKLVIRTGFVSEVGGAHFIQSLAGRNIRVRGLIARSPVFGYEISVTTRSMILAVQP